MLCHAIRTLCLVTALSPLVAISALAGPSVSLIWTGTTGAGALGGDSIEALPGDTLTLTVLIEHDAQNPVGIPFAALNLAFDPALLQGGAAVECPSAGSMPPGNNLAAGLCGGNFMTSSVGPALSVDNAAGFIGPAATMLLYANSPDFDFDLLAVDFVVTSALSTTSVDVEYLPGLDSVNDNNAAYFPAASATAVPEPGECVLLVVGALVLTGLARSRERRDREAVATAGAGRIPVASLAGIACVALGALTLAGTANAQPMDSDEDGVPDPFDNCLYVPNAPPYDCDVDQDGYGNACDTDYNNDFYSNLPDGGTFTAAFYATGSPNIVDANCDQIVGGPDHSAFIRLFGTLPGPSGLDCAGSIPCP